jgi:hypothetical protein
MARARLLLAALASSLASVSLPACLFSNPVDEEVDGYALATDMVEQLAGGACNWHVNCCQPFEMWWDFGFVLGGSSSACADAVVSSLQSGSEHPAIEVFDRLLLLDAAQDLQLGRVEIDPVAVDTCASFLSQRVCNVYEFEESENCLPGGPSTDDPCSRDKLFVGLVEAGGECRLGNDFQCKSGRCEGNFGVGICSATKEVEEECSFDWECHPDLYCEPIDRRCRVGAELGQLCSFVDPVNPQPGTELVRCAEGLFCDPLQARCVAPCTNGSYCVDDSECPEGLVCAVDRCRESGKSGDPCDSPTDCESLRCDYIVAVCLDAIENGDLCANHNDCVSAFCDPQTSRCQDPLEVGEPCPSFDDEQCDASFCDWSDNENPICRAYVAAGDSCDPLVDRCDVESDENLSCVDELCHIVPFPNGVSCPSDGWCESGICHLGVCEAGAPAGESCDSLESTLRCARDLFCDRLGGLPTGTCEYIHEVGEPCSQSVECWGECQLRWGTLMCDDTLSPFGEEAWCDMPSPGDPGSGPG